MEAYSLVLFVVIFVCVFFIIFTLNEYGKKAAEGSTDITLLVIALLFFIVLMFCFSFIFYRPGGYYYASS